MSGFIREQIVKRFTRSSGWSRVRKKYLVKHPICASCLRKATQVHHKKPFHEDSGLELCVHNLIGFCADHHFFHGHLMNWKGSNPLVESDARESKYHILTCGKHGNTSDLNDFL